MLALVVGLAALVVYIRLRRRADTPCVAPACVQLDAMLVEAQDKSVSPCDNFYQHTCGGWMRKHNTSVYRVRRTAFFQRLDDYLSKIKVATQHGATEKAAHFYQVCTDVVNGKRDNLDDFKKAFRNAGMLWPYLGRSSDSSPNDALLVAARVFTTFYVGSLLTIRGHLTDMGAFLHLEPDVSLPLWNSALRVFGKGTAQYRNYYDKCVNQFAGRPVSSEDTVNFTELLKIEHMMITRLLPARKTVKDLTLQSPQALNEYLNESRVQKLVKYYTDTYTPSGRAGAIISGIEYLGNFTDILDKVGDDKVIFYLGHVLIQTVLRMLSAKFNDIWYQELGRKVFPTTVNRAVEDCAHLTEILLGWSLFERFIRKSTRQAVAAHIQGITEKLSPQFIDTLKRYPWFGKLNVEDRNFTDVLYHYKRYSESILFNELRSLPAMKDSLADNWVAAANVVGKLKGSIMKNLASGYVLGLRLHNKYTVYAPLKRYVRMPPLFVDLPLTGINLTVAALHGSVGSLIAAGAVNLLYVEAKKNPEASKFWEDRRACFLESSAARNLTTNEPFFKAASIDFVAKLYQKEILEVGVENQGLRHFSADLTFFQVMCYLVCTGDAREIPEAEETCNTVARESTHFGYVFGCPSGSPMNPASRPQCSLLY